MKSTPARIAAIFFLSGVAALLYQVIWTKQLALQFGVTAHAVSTTVSVFMLGLALGTWLFGRLADRVRRPLKAYALLELGVAASALASLALLKAVEGVLSAGWLPEPGGAGIVAARALGTFVVLLVPSTLMGGTLPMLAKELVSGDGPAGSRVGLLYGLNALGGAAGSLLAGFLTIGWLGLSGSLLVGVGLNVVAGALAYALARSAPWAAAPVAERAPSPAVAPAAPASVGIHLAFFLAGLTGLAVEVVWTRMLLINVSSTAQSFAAMLAVYLSGLALGSVATARLADRVDPVRGYAVTQVLVGFSILLCAALWAGGNASSADVARWSVERLPSAWRGETSYKLVALAFQCGLLVLVPTVLMGCSFPFAGRAFARFAPQAGRRLGSAFSLNTLGSTLGPLLCGFLWLPLLGIQGTVALCATIALVAGAGLLLASGGGALRWAAPGLALAAITAAWLLPGDLLLAGTSQRAVGRLLSYEEDICGSVAVREVESGGQRVRQLLVGSTSMITDGFNCRRYTRLLGHLPMLLHADPRDALVICLGSGMTLSAVAAHPDLATIDCVELSPGVVRAARAWFGDANGRVLEDPRVRVLVNDGRTQLALAPKLYDIIALEPPPPDRDGVAALYSREFYELCRARLRPGGIVSQWIPYHGASLRQIRSLLAAVRSVFPKATLWELFDGREYCVLGHAEPSPLPLERIAQRFSVAGVQAHLSAVGIRRLDDLFACFVTGTQGIDAFAAGVPPTTDDRPTIGYDLEADNLVAPWSSRFERALQKAGLETAAHAQSPAEILTFTGAEARQAFLAGLAPAKAAARMHTLALRLVTLLPSEHTTTFMEPFTDPTSLDPGNPYYRYASRRGLYAMARAQQAQFLR